MYVISAHHRQLAQQIGVNPVPRCRLAGPRLGRHRDQAHLAHQALDPFAVDLKTLQAQTATHLSTAKKRAGRIELVDQAHQDLVCLTLPTSRPQIQTGAAQSQQLALPLHADLAMRPLDQGPLFLDAQCK
ncbi:MAG: hypothetical protein A2527_02070 [Candidatus Lambdaproteobacteria bacterium RIFOXYD2_FULL_50_16]|uniref:Uncharacterized protein n=1 Tax=Candidatus Lambdaproteobacteria bacterium RIFOXYD2_FULL_50_16 TaxID=1817772 RepID=A0A1F6GE53_9PROT|nr:MAG: hypothetical protein A2527_02070 [Candidatus Lambdaproteobacteria bacterium RIFOXYD2_FULL_50_16]